MNFRSLLLKSAIFASTFSSTTTQATEQPEEIKNIEFWRKSLAIREIQLAAERMSNLTVQEKEHLNYLLAKVKKGSTMREAIDCEIGR